MYRIGRVHCLLLKPHPLAHMSQLDITAVNCRSFHSTFIEYCVKNEFVSLLYHYLDTYKLVHPYTCYSVCNHFCHCVCNHLCHCVCNHLCHCVCIYWVLCEEYFIIITYKLVLVTLCVTTFVTLCITIFVTLCT